MRYININYTVVGTFGKETFVARIVRIFSDFKVGARSLLYVLPLFPLHDKTTKQDENKQTNNTKLFKS